MNIADNQIDNICAFLDSVICEELEKLDSAGLKFMNFVIMGQCIEVLGSFLDSKPMKAKGQSMKRFSLGVNYLFGGGYRVSNDNNMLYDTLRNQMTHTFVPGNCLTLVNVETEKYKHLSVVDGKLVLAANQFKLDIIKACQRLKQLLREKKIKAKNIAFEG